MHYSDELIEEVRASNNIVDVISSRIKLTRKGNTYWGLCPFHSEKTASFSVSPAKQMYYCFGCHAGGNVITFLREYDNMTFVEAVQTLADRVGINLPQSGYDRKEKERADRKAQVLEVNRAAANYFYQALKSEAGERARAYFTRRELKEETIRSFGLGYSLPYGNDLYQYLKGKGYRDDVISDSGLVRFSERSGPADKFWNRVMFPIMDVNNKVIGFGGRVMGDGEPKYLNSPETICFEKRKNLYGLNYARKSREDFLMLCEGYMDVIAMHQAGFTNAVASLGTALSESHAGLIKRYVDKVILVYDSDAAGTSAALRAIPMLREVGLSVRVLNMKPYKDPDEFMKALGAEEFSARIEAAENGFLFEVRMLEAKHDMKDPDSKTKFFREVARRLLQFEEELERENYVQVLSQKYAIEAKQLNSLIRTMSMTMSGSTPRQPQRTVEAVRQKEDGMQLSQKLFLTWLVERPELYEKTKDYVGPEDFTDEFFGDVARRLYEQLETGELNPAKIISAYESEEDQNRAAGIFNATIGRLDTKEDMEKALNDTIYRLKENSIKVASERLAPTDLQGLQKLVNERKALQELRRLHVSI